MLPRFYYEFGAREANDVSDGRTNEDLNNGKVWAFSEGYLIYDRTVGNSEEQAIAMAFDVDTAERIVTLMNLAAP